MKKSILGISYANSKEFQNLEIHAHPSNAYSFNGFRLIETSDNTDQVLRGGSWGFSADLCRVADRYDKYPSGAYDVCGFRLVEESDPSRRVVRDGYERHIGFRLIENFDNVYSVYRGGSWDFYASFCRVSFRNLNTPDSRDDDLGFRLIEIPDIVSETDSYLVNGGSCSDDDSNCKIERGFGDDLPSCFNDLGFRLIEKPKDTFRGFCGGSCYTNPAYARVALYVNDAPGYHRSILGFRLIEKSNFCHTGLPWLIIIYCN